MNTYRYHIESKTPSIIPSRKFDRFFGGGKIKGESLVDAQAKLIDKRKNIAEEIVALSLQKMDKPIHCKGKIIFSFDYDFTARDEVEVNEVINSMFDYWYDGQDDELYDALVNDIGKDVAMDIEFDVSNATVTIEEV